MTANAAQHLVKVRDLAATARSMLEYGIVLGVSHFCYYAMFHAALAVMIDARGSAPTNHGRLLRAFGQFARTEFGADGQRIYRAMSKAYYGRIEADYNPRVFRAEVEAEAAQLVGEMDFLLQRCADRLRRGDPSDPAEPS